MSRIKRGETEGKSEGRPVTTPGQDWPNNGRCEGRVSSFCTRAGLETCYISKLYYQSASNVAASRGLVAALRLLGGCQLLPQK